MSDTTGKEETEETLKDINKQFGPEPSNFMRGLPEWQDTFYNHDFSLSRETCPVLPEETDK